MSYYKAISSKRKLISFLFFGLFLCSAYIQLNDPDPYHWFAIYFIVALLHVFSLFKPISKRIYWFIFFLLIAYSLYHFSYFMDWIEIDNKNEIFGEMVYEKPYLEGTREFLGLLICALSLLYPLNKTNQK
ncbi:MAG: hypothetical protein BM563_09530 [Bacteroidetes bacterium MedPE-SWsnd-G1]|nr:MAG: hypothetical protein BM563_09530 [Bacteroidetes bacterium MedPE-SWsnd-G1]